jgi:hypothetical protein
MSVVKKPCSRNVNPHTLGYPDYSMETNGFVQFPAIKIPCLERASIEYIHVSLGISVHSAACYCT